jgi:hypothetical protein
MNLAPLTQSVNVIDLTSMIYLMPAQFDSAIQTAKLSGLLFGAGMGIGISWLALMSFTILARRT